MRSPAAYPLKRKAAVAVPKRILFMQNCPEEGIGLYDQYLQELRIPWIAVQAYAGESLPPPSLHDAVIVGGTPISVNEIDRHDYLVAETSWLKSALDLGIPVLGICFGAKLLGAEVKKNPVREIGIYPVRLTAAGRSDPLFQGFPKVFPVFHWHGDTFDIPPWGVRLATGWDCPNQGFRMGSAVGLQFHLEVTAPEVCRWANAYADELHESGMSKVRVTRECRKHEVMMAELAGRLLDNFLADIVT